MRRLTHGMERVVRLSHLEQLQFFEDLADGEPNWWPGVLIRVMDGESLKDIAADHACFGVVLREWIKREDDREAAYQDSLEKKREMCGEELLDTTISAARSTLQDAQTSSGDWLEVGLWPKGLLAAAESVEFSPDGRPYKIKMESGKARERLAKMLGMEKTEQNVNLSVSLVSVLSGMPAGAPRLRPGAVEDAKYVEPEKIEKVADAGEAVQAATPTGTLLLDTPPRREVIGGPL